MFRFKIRLDLSKVNYYELRLIAEDKSLKYYADLPNDIMADPQLLIRKVELLLNQASEDTDVFTINENTCPTCGETKCSK